MRDCWKAGKSRRSPRMERSPILNPARRDSPLARLESKAIPLLKSLESVHAWRQAFAGLKIFARQRQAEDAIFELV